MSESKVQRTVLFDADLHQEIEDAMLKRRITNYAEFIRTLIKLGLQQLKTVEDEAV